MFTIEVRTAIKNAKHLYPDYSSLCYATGINFCLPIAVGLLIGIDALIYTEMHGGPINLMGERWEARRNPCVDSGREAVPKSEF